MEGSIYEVPHNSSFNLQTLKRNNKKCGKEEVSRNPYVSLFTKNESRF